MSVILLPKRNDSVRGVVADQEVSASEVKVEVPGEGASAGLDGDKLQPAVLLAHSAIDVN